MCANVAFIAINSVQIAIILRERQDITLEPHEKAVYEAVFEAAHLSKRQVIHMYILYVCVCVCGVVRVRVGRHRAMATQGDVPGILSSE